MDENKSGIDYNVVLADLEAKKAQIESAIQGIKTLLGASVEISGHNSPGKEKEIKFDSFVGLGNIEATIKYLRMCKQPKTSKEIIEALEKGGLEAKYPTISSQLSRRAANEGDIVIIGRGKWALQEFYPEKKNDNKEETGDLVSQEEATKKVTEKK
jgi:hypothetical protein